MSSDDEKKEIEIDDIVTLTFSSMDAAIKDLGKIPETAKRKTDALLNLFDGDIFASPSKFLKSITDLSEEIGHANHVVLEIDLRRQGIIHSNPTPPPTPQITTTQPERSQLIVQTQPPKGGGFMDYLSTRKMAGVWRDFLQSQKGEQPQITTSKEATDVLDYGRQLIAESNRTHKYYEQSLAHLKFFNDAETKERFTSNLREHLNKISGIIRAFCRTAVEYRKELAGERKSDMAKAVIALKMAEFQSTGGMTTADYFRMAREAMGGQDAGNK